MVARLSEPGAALLSYENLLLQSLSTQWRPSQRSCHIHVTARETFPFMRSIEGGMRQPFLDWIEPFDLEVWVAGEHASTRRLSRDLRVTPLTCPSFEDPNSTQVGQI